MLIHARHLRDCVSAAAMTLALAAAGATRAQDTAAPSPGASAAQSPAIPREGAAPPLASAGASAGQIDEVIVTAQRRTQNLQNVPIAVSSFSSSALQNQQITSTLDLGRVVPNLFASENVGVSSANVYYIRGLGQTESFPTFEPQVGTYVDDIYIARQNANNFALFGVDSVQVLRGPQGTLFGRNSTGGAILVTLQKPQNHFGGDVEVGYGSYETFSGRASVDLPINDQVLTRTSVYGLTNDGYVRNVTTHENLNDSHNLGVREAIRVLPKNLPNVEWNLAADYQQSDGTNVLNFPNSPGGVHGAGRVAFTGFSTEPGALSTLLTGAKGQLGQGAFTRSYGIESNIAVKFDAGTLNVISGFRGLSEALAADFPDADLGPIQFDAASPVGQFALAQSLKNYQYSQELKFTGNIGTRLTYTTGVFYLFETSRDNYGAAANLAGVLGVPGLLSFTAPLGDEYTKNQTISEAVYLQGDYKLTDKLTFTAGGRFTHEIKTLLAAPNVPALGFTTADIQANGYSTHLDTNKFTPRFALQYQFSPQVMVFGSATRGFQGGGWNGLSFSAKTFNDFGPETVWSYETGFRSETPDRKLRVNGTLFYTNVNNYQSLTDLPQAASFVTTNAASLESYGGEFDITWKPIERLTLSSNIGLIRAFYFDPSATVRTQQAACIAAPGAANTNCGTGIVRLNGRLAEPEYVPPLTASFSGEYAFVMPGYTLTPKAGVQYTAREFVGTAGTEPGLDRSRVLLDLGLTLNLDQLPISVTAECKNCTDVDYGITYLFGYKYYNVPRSYGVRVSYRF